MTNTVSPDSDNVNATPFAYNSEDHSEMTDSVISIAYGLTENVLGEYLGLVENAKCGVPECGVTESRSAGVPECRSPGVPEPRNPGVPECRNTGVPIVKL